MKLQNYTKAELISKLNKIKNDKIEQKSSIINKLKSYLSKLIELIINFKSILLKITLLTFFMKIFRKYRIFRRIWTILNSIIVSIFGLSLIDNFGFDLVNKVIFEIKYISYSMVDYLTNSQFYKYLSDLFNKNDEIQSNKTNIINKEIVNKELIRKHKSSGGVWTPTDTPEYKLSEWLKNKDQNQDIQEPEINYNKYFLIAGTIIIISCLGWVYWDEITTGGTSFLEWIRSFRGDNNPGNGDLPREGRINPRAELERLVRERTIETEEKLSDLIDKPKGKSVRIMSPSLEDLNEKVQESWNASPTSTTSSIETVKASSIETVNPSSSSIETANPSSSIETAKASTSSIETVNPSEIKKESPFPLSGSFQPSKDLNEDKFSLLDLKTKWKDIIKPELRQSIEYVEKHLPKNELDDTNYINTLLEDIARKNVEFLKDLNNNSDRLKASKLIYYSEIGKNVDKWVEEMRTEINKFE
jgi:hypothetical protein